MNKKTSHPQCLDVAGISCLPSCSLQLSELGKLSPVLSPYPRCYSGLCPELHNATIASIIVTWWSGFGGIQAWSLTTNWFPSVLWYCWFGHLACKNHPRNDLLCVDWDIKPYTLTHSPLPLSLCLHHIVPITMAFLQFYCWLYPMQLSNIGLYISFLSIML